MLVSVFCCCDEFVDCVEYRCFEVFVTVCGSLASKGQAGDAANVAGEFGRFGVAFDGGWNLLYECFTDLLGNGLGDECF